MVPFGERRKTFEKRPNVEALCQERYPVHVQSSSKYQFVTSIRKGLDSDHVGDKVWSKICGVDELTKKYGNDLYNQRLNTILDSEVVQAIRTDLPRTFPDNIYFIPQEGSQEQLYRILFAFAADNKVIGYCQVSY